MIANVITGIVGKVFTSIEVAKESIKFVTDGETWIMHHDQDCCESVEVEEVIGDINDLVGVPIVVAEEREEEGKNDDDGSTTFTFYDSRTIKGTVTIRWCGSSNGYYSESVSFSRIVTA